MDVWTALGTGAAAGLGVALPLGAIGVLLISEGVARGFRGGWPAGVAVGLVDTLYCALAIFLGAVAAPTVAAWGRWPVLAGGSALIVLGVIGLVRALRPPPVQAAETTADGRGRRFLLFLGLTSINPATLIYFAAIAVGLGQALQSPPTAGAFIAGVGIASAGWQLLLIGAGAVLGERSGPRTRRLTAVLGNLVVAGLGAAMVLGAWA